VLFSVEASFFVLRHRSFLFSSLQVDAMVTFILATSGHLKSFVYNKRLRRIDGRWEESQNLAHNITVFWETWLL